MEKLCVYFLILNMLITIHIHFDALPVWTPTSHINVCPTKSHFNYVYFC